MDTLPPDGGRMFEEPSPEPAIPPLCCECSHLLGRRINLEAAKSWQCAAPQNIADLSRDPVTGNAVYVLHYSTCYDARGSHDLGITPCGPSGQWFKLYEHPRQTPASLNLGPRKGKPAAAEDLLAELDTL